MLTYSDLRASFCLCTVEETPMNVGYLFFIRQIEMYRAALNMIVFFLYTSSEPVEMIKFFAMAQCIPFSVHRLAVADVPFLLQN